MQKWCIKTYYANTNNLNNLVSTKNALIFAIEVNFTKIEMDNNNNLHRRLDVIKVGNFININY